MDVPEAWTKATGAGVTVGHRRHRACWRRTRTSSARSRPTRGRPGPTALGRDKRSNGVDDDGNGYVDDWHGWDFVSAYPSIGVSEGDDTAGPDNDPQDNHGHGTHVAGTVAAQRDNNEGIAGVAPGAKVMPLRALGGNRQRHQRRDRRGVRLRGQDGPARRQRQPRRPGPRPDAAVGDPGAPEHALRDRGRQLQRQQRQTPHGPCALPAANILCVGASDVDDRRAAFSNYGAHERRRLRSRHGDPVDLHRRPAYAYLQGTSMASPNTAGVAALVLSARPGASALDVKSAIMASADAKPDLAGKAVTGGRVNADRAVTGAIGGAPVNVTPPVITGTPRQGVALGASTGTWSPPGTSYAYVWQRSHRRRRDVDGDRRRDRVDLHPRRVGHRAQAARRRSRPRTRTASRARPRPRSAPVASGAPVDTSPPVINGTPAPRPGPDRQLAPGTRPARPTPTSGSARPTASPGRRSAATPRATRSRPPSATRACA